MISWTQTWLTDKRQRVRVEREISNWKTDLSGVPQGSVLGPILLFLFIHDLDDDFSSKVLKSAGDIKVYRTVKTRRR